MELEPEAKPKFCKSRSVPFALREQVEEAIWQQVEDGELEPAESSEWAAPIVVVKKKDGGVRICADFKVTINPHLRSKVFLLPTLDEVFSALAQGESFSTIDLARAYKQIEVTTERVSPILPLIRIWACSAIDACLLVLPHPLLFGRRQCQLYCKVAGV